METPAWLRAGGASVDQFEGHPDSVGCGVVLMRLVAPLARCSVAPLCLRSEPLLAPDEDLVVEVDVHDHHDTLAHERVPELGVGRHRDKPGVHHDALQRD